MSRVIKSAIWEDKPWLVEVPPPKFEEPVPEETDPELEPSPLEMASVEPVTEEDNGTLALEAMMREAESKRIEAETLLAAAKQEAIAIFTNTKVEVDAEREKAEEEIARSRELAEKEAAELVQKAADEAQAMREETERLRTEAEAEAVDIREKARQEGHQEGYDAGWKEGTEKAQAEQHQAIVDANALAEKTIKDAEQEKEQYVQQAEEEIVGVILHAVDKILPQHFIDAPQIILPLVRKALLKIKDQSRIVIHVCPEHYDFVLIAKSEFQTMLEGNGVLEVTSDDSLSTGDVVLETPNGNVDARLATQIELVKKAVQDVML